MILSFCVFLHSFLHACSFAIQFGEAFEAVPRVLASNSGQDATNIVAQLYEAHADGKNPNIGVDIAGGVKDLASDGVYDLLVTKESSIRLAVEASLTVLRVDQIIMSKPAKGGGAVVG